MVKKIFPLSLFSFLKRKTLTSPRPAQDAPPTTPELIPLAGSPHPTECVLGRSCVQVGRFTYGVNVSHILQWDEGTGLQIGNFCSIAVGVHFMLGGNHSIDWITTYPFGFAHADDLGGPVGPPGHYSKGDIRIGNDVWIGRNALILSGVTIGDGAAIAAHSVVAHDVPPYAIAGGNPAKFIRFRFGEEMRALLSELRWWDLSTADIKEIRSTLCSKPSVALLNGLLKKYRPDSPPL